MNDRAKHNFILKFVALLLAIITWMYVKGEIGR